MPLDTLTTLLSTEVITFQPEGAAATFGVTVQNPSATRASFQLTVEAAGVEGGTDQSWYRVAPAVSSKIPGGASAHFEVEILAIPPVPRGFSGTMNLTVRVVSPELRLEDRQVLRLVVAGSSRLPPRLMLPVTAFRGQPGQGVEVPVQVQNLNRQAVDVHLVLGGLPRPWLPEGEEKPLHLQAGQTKAVQFICQIPAPTAAPSGHYPLTVTATQQQTVPVVAEAQLQVLVAGQVTMACTPPQQTLPPKRGLFYNRPLVETTIAIAFTNDSNQVQSVSAIAHYPQPRLQRRIATSAAPDPATPDPEEFPSLEAAQTVAPEALAEESDPLPPRHPYLRVTPPTAPTAIGETTTLDLAVGHPLPWWGWPRRRTLVVEGDLAPPVAVSPPETTPSLPLLQREQTLELRVLPVIPFWLQLVGAGAFVVLTLWLWWAQIHRGHRGPVNSVEFSGQGHEMVSAGDDQTLVRWGILGHMEWRYQALQADKALRVAAYHPRGNTSLWAGFENGQIQGWDLLSRRIYTLTYAQEDRIFDLAIPAPGNTLFSGHGSGLILEWDITPGRIPLAQTQPQRGFEAGFAVQALTLVGAEQTHLVAAGRFNRLVLINLATEEVQPLAYPPGDGNQYIWNLATATEKPYLLAAADSQGRISLWDLSSCLGERVGAGTAAPCQLLDDWTTGHGGAPVRGVALSADGCYLVSGGEDGRVMVWPLSSQGRRRLDGLEGRTWKAGGDGVTAVDIQQQLHRLWVAYGTDAGAVNLRTRSIAAPNLPPGECAATSPR